MEERKFLIKDVCVACGKPMPTESNRMICKECEEKANESNSKVR